jgi:Tol biopolymer transport system component
VRRDENGTDLYRKRIDGSRDPRRLTSDAQEEAWPSVSPDGRYVIYSARQPDGSYDLWYRSLSEEAEPVRFTLTDTDERMPVFSPDGRYVAYAGEVNGKYEIQARSFPGGVEAGQVSEAGGLAPAWVGDDLFFVQDNTLMAASVDTRSGFSARTAAEVVFSGEPLASLLADTQTRRYAVGKDGQRFLMARPEENARIEVMIVENWIRLLDREKGR